MNKKQKLLFLQLLYLTITLFGTIKPLFTKNNKPTKQQSPFFDQSTRILENQRKKSRRRRRKQRRRKQYTLKDVQQCGNSCDRVKSILDKRPVLCDVAPFMETCKKNKKKYNFYAQKCKKCQRELYNLGYRGVIGKKGGVSSDPYKQKKKALEQILLIMIQKNISMKELRRYVHLKTKRLGKRKEDDD